MIKVAQPTVFPKPGTYSTNKIHVNLMTYTKGAVVYYTLDGSDPDESSLAFHVDQGLLTLKADDPFIQKDNEIIVRTNEEDSLTEEKEFVIKAIAKKEGYLDSDVVTFHYGIKTLPRDQFYYTILQEKSDNAPAVIRIEDHYQAKMYFVLGSERGLLIDGGFEKDLYIKELLDTLADGIPYDMFVTHAHPDHDAQAQRLIEDGIACYFNAEDLPTYDKFGGTLTGFIDFKHGDVFDLGDCQLKGYKVPGHTVGHMVLLDEENGLLFASDAFGNNRNTLLDTAFIHLGKEESTMDRYLSVLQAFRAQTKGRIKKIFLGHNDTVLTESFLENLEKAVQQAVDYGEEILTPTLRPESECFGSGKISLVGNYISDLDWVGVNIINLYSGNYTANTISTLSGIFLEKGELSPPFHPETLQYTIVVEKDIETIHLAAVATSSRISHLSVNGQEAKSGEYLSVPVEKDKGDIIKIKVIAPNGKDEKTYEVKVNIVG